MEFYDVKTRMKVNVPKSKIRKVKYTQKNGQVRFALRGYTDDNRKLTKFVNKAVWDEMAVPDVSESENISDDMAYLRARAARGDLKEYHR